MEYSAKVIDIFKNPRNAGSLRGANAVGKAGNSACGDIMKIYLYINDEGVIEEAKFKTFGCAAAIAATSVACDMIKGMTIEEALEVKNSQVIDYLGGLPPQKIHCSLLAEEAIHAAIEDYYRRKEKEAKDEPDGDEDEE